MSNGKYSQPGCSMMSSIYCSDYPVDCACNQGMSCQVMRANFTIVNRMQIGRFIPVNDENQPYVKLCVNIHICIHL